MKKVLIDELGPDECNIVDRHEGGFGVVYILENNRGKYALKTLKSEYYEILTEAEYMVSIPKHLNVMNILGFSNISNNHGILMPYFPRSLRSIMNTKIALEKAIEFGLQIAEGIMHLNKNGIIHLDLKPENILIDDNGIPVISDFGLAKHLRKDPLGNIYKLELKNSGTIGTLGYMAPEQLVQTDLSVRTDIYSFGIILYEMITGRIAVKGETIDEIYYSILHDKPIFLNNENAPNWLISLINRMTEKNLKQRPSIEEVSLVLKNNRFIEEISVNTKSNGIEDEINRANALAQIGKNAEAIEIYNMCLDLDPFLFVALSNRAEAYFASGFIDKAIESATTAYLLIQGEPEQKYQEEQIILNLGYYYMARNDEYAYEITKIGITKYPENWELLFNHAEICRLLEVKNNASILLEGFECAKKAVNIQPNIEGLRITYAWLLKLTNKIEEFIPYLNKLMIDVGEHSVAAWNLFLKSHIDFGNFEFAERKIKEFKSYPSFKPIIEELENYLAKRKET